MSKFIGNLDVRLLADTSKGSWKLMCPLSFDSEVLGKVITAPFGFVTDFCSVPRIPLAYDLLGDRFRMSGTIHDYLYESHVVDRDQADRMLKEMLLAEGAEEVEAEAFFLAVRLGGESHWTPAPKAS